MNTDRFRWEKGAGAHGPRFDLWDNRYGFRVAMLGYTGNGLYRPVALNSAMRWESLGDGPMTYDEAKNMVEVTIRLEDK